MNVTDESLQGESERRSLQGGRRGNFSYAPPAAQSQPDAGVACPEPEGVARDDRRHEHEGHRHVCRGGAQGRLTLVSIDGGAALHLPRGETEHQRTVHDPRVGAKQCVFMRVSANRSPCALCCMLR